MTFLQNIRNRELGLSHRQPDELLRKVTASKVVKDLYSSKIIELPQDRIYSYARHGDFVAVLSITNADIKVRSVALWSLLAKSKLWEIELDYNYQESNPGSALLSSNGVVLVGDLSLRNLSKIVFNGKQTGTLPNLHYDSVHCIGMRILTSWKERHHPQNRDPRWFPENSSAFFGEWDYEGKILSRYPLDFTRGRWGQEYAYNEHYWVRISGTVQEDFPPIIEVVHRTQGEIKTFELPQKLEKVALSSPFIVQDLLFYGTNIMRQNEQYCAYSLCDPAIHIFDLPEGKVIEKIPTGGKNVRPINLVANESYVAWLENKQIKYLDIQSKVVHESIELPDERFVISVNLDIVDTLLTIIYNINPDNNGRGRWHRKVIDLSDGQLKYDILYKTSPLVQCSFSNGTMLVPNDSEMYVESYQNSGLSKNEPSPYRRS